MLGQVKMRLIISNTSLATFPNPEVKLLYLDPYNNTFGENNWVIVILTMAFCVLNIFAKFLGLGIMVYEKHGHVPGNRKLLDMLISFGMLIGIIQSGPVMFLITYRNVFGPFQNTKLVFGLLYIKDFGEISQMMLQIAKLFIWYLTEKVLKSQYEMDEVGMAECIEFFVVALSLGLTILISSVGKFFHLNIIQYVGLPLDFTDKYLVVTRYVLLRLHNFQYK